MFVQLVVVLLGVWMPLVRCQAGSECIEDRTQAISVVLNGARNLTGNWISQVVLRHNENQSSAAPAHTVQVEHRTFKCGADNTHEVSIAFIEPSSFSRIDYELFPGQGHYKFHVTRVTWSAARDACAAEGSHLMILNSQEEVEVFKTLFARQPTARIDYAWLGVYKRNALWVTVLGGPLNSTGYVVWHPGRPSTQPEWDYVLGERTTVQFHDNPLRNKFPFICEHQL